MNYQTRLFTEDERSFITEKLNILFALNDKTLSEEKRTIWLSELEKLNYPVKSILMGLDSIKTDDLQGIRFPVVMGAIRRFIEHSEDTRKSCQFCFNGFIQAKDGEGRIFGLSCQCENGKKDLIIWNGEDIQNSRGRLLTIQKKVNLKE